jgi:hypothetical protein
MTDVVDFKLKGTEDMIASKPKRSSAKKRVEGIKGKEKIDAVDYVAVLNPKGKKDNVDEVAEEMAVAVANNHLGLPKTFYELTREEQTMAMFYFSSDFIHPMFGKRTHMNPLMAYVTAYLDEDDIRKVWKVVEGEDGEAFVKGVKNYAKYGELELKAIKAFNDNPSMRDTLTDMMVMAMGAKPEEKLKLAIFSDALHSDNYNDRNANRRMLIDILGIKKDQQPQQQVNLYFESGGNKLIKNVVEMTGDTALVVESDFEVGDLDE